MFIKAYLRNGKRLTAILIMLTFLLQAVVPVPGLFAEESLPGGSAVSTVEEPSAGPPEPPADPADPPAEPEQTDPEELNPEELEEEPEGTVHLEKLPIELVPLPPEEKPLDVITIGGQEARVKPGEIIVRYKEQPQKAGRMSFNAGQSTVSVTAVVYEASPEIGLEETLEQLREDPNVLYAEPNYELYALDAPDDTHYGEQWGLQRINAVTAWTAAELIKSSDSAAPVTLAVLDTGVDSGHDDLNIRVLSGHNALTGGGNSEDDSMNSHGTLVAGIAAASTNNGIGVAGTAGAYPVSILPVKVLDAADVGSMLSVANGIYWAADNGAQVINLSLGARLPDYPVTLAEAVRYAQGKGAVVVAAGGNEGKEVQGFYPACLPGVIAVMASDRNDDPASFSNYNSRTEIMEVVAPGVDILSTAKEDAYKNITGTSAAAPFVSGAAALLWSVFPGKTPAELTDALTTGGDIKVSLVCPKPFPSCKAHRLPPMHP
ncbi:MAG: S8 family serine peptidase [Clostridia bacterium]|nr:S8 family serine peptidase [Clostridia bacterium]